MESSEHLSAWVHTQRDAYRRFFAAEPPAQGPHVSLLVAHEDIVYLGPGEHGDAYLRFSHCMQSQVLPLHFAVCGGAERTVLVPAPGEDGVFTINGTRYTVPFQRLVWQVKPRRIEYRRLDHVIVDGWTRRRRQSDNAGRSWADLAAEATEERAFTMLGRYLQSVLTPKRRGEHLFLLLGADINWLGVSARQTQVATLRVDWDEQEEWVPGKTRYHNLRRSVRLGEGARTLRDALDGSAANERERAADDADADTAGDDGLDVFHTPEGGDIGLTRYLTCGAFVDEDRRLCADAAKPVGLLPAFLPFAQHNDGRRLMMACGMLTRSVPLENGGPPACSTTVERLVLGSFAGVHANLGVDLRVGFMFWEGLNYEDAIVVSQTAQTKLYAQERRTVSVPVPCFCSFEPLERGTTVRRGQKLGTFHYSPSRLSLAIPTTMPETMRRQAGFFPDQLEWLGTDCRAPCEGVIEEIRRVDLWAEDCPGATRFSGRFDFTILIERPLSVGDKLCNRHGNKGVVAAILPDELMPQVDGQPLEILFNPIGVINRGNYGQLLEALTATDAHSNLVPDVCEDPRRRIRALLEAHDAPGLRYSTVTVRHEDGQVASVRAVTGLNHILRLPHYAADHLNATCGSVYSSITEQPPAGQAQKYGEMEIAALQAHGAHAILAELCRSRSRQTPSADASSQCAQRPIVEGLRAAGLCLQSTAETATIAPADLVTAPEHGTELFAPDAKSSRDLSCNVDANPDRSLALRTVLTRLSSHGFFEDNPDVYVDLGRTVDLQVTTGKVGDTYRMVVRYVPVLHPKYRPNPPGTRGRSLTTARYEALISALWHARAENAAEPKANHEQVAMEELGALFRHLHGRLRGKHGVIRRVGLSRRLTYSGRFVIVPGPELTVEQVSLPWDATRVLYRNALLDAGISHDIVRTPASEMPADERDRLGQQIDTVLRGEWVLLNRNPSLHKYSILSFRPRTHFDTEAMRLPPLVTSPFGADFDGDQMSVVPLFEPRAKEEAARLSVAHNLVSAANGAPTVLPAKDFRLALQLTLSSPAALEALNRALSACSIPPLAATAVEAPAETWFFGLAELAPERSVEALRLVVEHGRRVLWGYTAHSCIGDFQAMADFLAPLLDSGAAKRDVMDRNRDLVVGLPSHSLRSRGVDSTGVMVSAKVAMGDFGGYQRRLYYRLRECHADGLAFDGPMRDALTAIQSITERATQQALGAKSAASQLRFRRFQKLVEALLSSNDLDPEGLREFSEVVGIDQTHLRRHVLNLLQSLLIEPPTNSLLRYLARQQLPTDDGLPLESVANRRDPRVAIFLS